MPEVNPDPPSREDYELIAEFRYKLRLFLRFSEEAAHRHGLTPQQYQALLALEGYPGRNHATVGELAERLQTAHHSTVGLVDRLERRGLVRRDPAPEDGRKVLLTLTPEGRRTCEKIFLLHREELRNLGPQLAKLLRKAAENLAGSRRPL